MIRMFFVGALPGLESQPRFLTNQENQSIFAVLETANLNGTKRKNPMFFLSVGTNGFSMAVWLGSPVAQI